MSTNKYLALLRRTLAKAGFCDVAIERPPGHVKIAVRHLDGRTQVVIASGTPSIPEHAVNNVLQDIKRFSRGHYGHD